MNEVCFEIDGKRLYLDEELVEFDIPIFFMCKDEKNDKYAVLCVDSKKMVYIIVKTDIEYVIRMLESQITLRDFFLSTCERWRVCAGEEYWMDHVEKIKLFREQELPVADTYFELENNKIGKYVKRLFEERRMRQYSTSYEKIYITYSMPSQEKEIFIKQEAVPEVYEVLREFIDSLLDKAQISFMNLLPYEDFNI